MDREQYRAWATVEEHGSLALAANGELQEEADSVENRLYAQMDEHQHEAYRLLRLALQQGRIEEVKAAVRAALVHCARAEKLEAEAERWGNVIVEAASREASHERQVVSVALERRKAVRNAAAPRRHARLP